MKTIPPTISVQLVLIAVLVLPIPAAAQNLLQNPQFDTGILDWGPPEDTPTWNSGDRFGSLTSGSIEATVTDIYPTGATQCVVLPGGDTWEVAFDVRRATSDDDASALVKVWWYATTTCTDYLGSNYRGVVTGSEWSRVSRLEGSPPGTASAIAGILATCYGATGVLLFDNAYFGIPVIFEDGFSSAHTSRWTSTVPPTTGE